VIFLLAGNVNEFGAETMHKVLVKKSFGNPLLGRVGAATITLTLVDESGFENDRYLKLA
jgi:hypothetical protein